MNKKIILGILISVVLIYLSVRGINLQDVLNDLKKIQLSYVILFILLMIFMQYLRSYRWGVILQPMEKIDQVPLFSITSVGFLAIAAIPARIGELARPYLISKRSSIKMPSALGTILIERILDSFTVLTIATVVLLIDMPFDLPSWMVKSSIIFSLLALSLFCFILFLILRREAALKFINIILNKLPGKLANKIDIAIHHFIDGLQIVTNIKLFSYLLFLSARNLACGCPGDLCITSGFRLYPAGNGVVCFNGHSYCRHSDPRSPGFCRQLALRLCFCPESIRVG